jgi:hypothetical protein
MPTKKHSSLFFPSVRGNLEKFDKAGTKNLMFENKYHKYYKHGKFLSLPSESGAIKLLGSGVLPIS